jgi:hypothetical protein
MKSAGAFRIKPGTPLLFLPAFGGHSFKRLTGLVLFGLPAADE